MGVIGGFKQGRGVNFFLIFKSHSGCCVENELERVNMELGNQQGGCCYNPDKGRQGLVLGC